MGGEINLRVAETRQTLNPPHASSLCTCGVCPDADFIGGQSHERKQEQKTRNGEEGREGTLGQHVFPSARHVHHQPFAHPAGLAQTVYTSRVVSSQIWGDMGRHIFAT